MRLKKDPQPEQPTSQEDMVISEKTGQLIPRPQEQEKKEISMREIFKKQTAELSQHPRRSEKQRAKPMEHKQQQAVIPEPDQIETWAP